MKTIFTLLLIVLLQACGQKQLEAPMPPAFVQNLPSDWPEAQKKRQDEKSDYISKHSVAYEWFSNFAFSETDGVPYIALMLLPRLAPELWGDEDNFLDVVGLFTDERQAEYPVARGIGISAFTREDPAGNIDYASFTCAACHIGRVRMDGGEIHYIDGGVNTEFNIVQYRVRVYKTLQKIVGSEKDEMKKQELITSAFLNALKNVQAENNHYFYKNYKNQWITFDAEYEKMQIDLFKKTAATTVAKFYHRAVSEYTGYGALLDKNYKGFQEESLQGFPGMADATGISTVNGYISAQSTFLGRMFASFILPPSPGITDFMSVWEQQNRKASWDNNHQTLINGGGQWNGNIPIPMYRNLAAQLTLGLDNNDIRVSAFGVELLDGLPATVYPFDVDLVLAKKGKALFTDNCARCHQPRNGKIYTNLGVNLDRSYVVNWLIRKAALEGFDKICSPSTTVNMNNKDVKPCASFDGVSLEGKKSLIMSSNNQHHGYSARPLNGIWAQAPYLHNGSVPTIYHLLMPDERPQKFIKSRLDYDISKVGFSWQLSKTSTEKENEGYVFDTASFPTFSNAGHDTDIIDGEKIYKLNWSEDVAGANAIIEYLKTL